jgi:diguanylate cyclase (GGDEF)-like protein/PAS domain S-box-containing protein
MDDAGAVPSALPRRYVIRRSLKSGNGVETLLAEDTSTGLDVVVKSIDPGFVPAAARLRFEHEAEVLRHLSGVGLIGLHDAGSTADRLYLVQPFVDGPGLDEVLARGVLSLPSALRVGIDLATALDVAHSAGVCHRDLKPANIVLDAAEPVGRATLIDFGFARSPWLHESIRDELVGTLRYLAPESAGVLASPADERSDLYALGVVLYECLAGRPPFTGSSVGDLLRQHLSAPVPLLRDCGIPVPRALDAVLQRLLRKDPAERYQSASALAGDLSELLHALESGDSDPRLVVGRLDRRRSLTDPVFIGREAELEELAAVVQGLGGGFGGLVLLEAESGGGKSRLLTELAQLASRSGVAVLHGQSVAQAGQRPYSLLHGVADDLVHLLEGDDDARAALVAALAELAPAAGQALPQLHDLLGEQAAPTDAGPEQFGEQRSLLALHRLLRSLGTAERPALLVLDDCQWADTLTVRLLEGLFAGDDGAGHVCVVAAYRSEEVAADHPLRRIAGARSLVLGPLAPQAMALLAESMAGPLPQAALDVVVRLADGSPFMGAAVLRGLVEAGALLGDEQGWRVDEAALGSVQTTRRAAGVLVQRLELLQPEVLALLSVGAVLGKQFDVEAAVRLAGTGDGAAQALEDARRRRLLWVDERTGRCSFFHDKVREALLERLDDDARRALHGRAADALAEAGDQAPADLVFDLAYHYDAAGRSADALPHALAGATLARTRHALDTAVLHYRMAQRAAAATAAADSSLHLQIADGLGDVLTLQGAYEDAEGCLLEARRLVRGATATAALDGKLGDLAFKRGDMTLARHHLEGALAQLGRRVPRATVILLVFLLWELAVQAAHTLLPHLLVGRRRTAPPEAHVLAMRLHSRLAYVYWFGSGLVACGWSHLRGMNLAERYAPSAELGQAWSEHAPVMTMLPWFSRGRRYADRSLEVRRDLGDVWGQGQSLGFTGVVAYAASDFGVAANACAEAVQLLERTGDQWEVNTARWHVAMCLHRLGSLVEAAALAERTHTDAAAIGDRTSAAIALSVLARASGGAVDGALVQEELAHRGSDVHRTSELHLALALHLRREGRLEAAAEQLQEGIAAARRAGLRQEYVAVVPAWRATVLRELVEATPTHDPRLRRARLRAAARASRHARAWAVSYRNNAPHALREAGLVASLQGRARRADRLLSRSCEVAQAQGARYEQALSELALAELSLLRGGPHHDVEKARAAVRAIEQPDGSALDAAPRPMMSLSDRFSTLLDVGRRLAAATSSAAVEAAVRDAALLLLRGERCHLVQVDALRDSGLTTASGESIDEVSRTLLTRAVELGQPVTAGDVSTDDSESLLLSGVRSVLAAPVVVHGEASFCFYVTHRQLGQLFGAEEVQLAAFIATLAGAAFEHLAGSEARFRSLAQNSSDVITLVDRSGVVEYQSEAAARVFGNDATGVVGRRVQEWAHPADVERLTEALEAAARGTEVRIECRLKHNDGGYRHAETSITNLLDVPHLAALVLNTRDVTERRVLEDQLRERALHDALTGLPNRALFLDRAQQALDRRRRRPEPVVVAFLDLDDFKAVNDTFGHSAGDELLIEMTRRLLACVRPSDTVARLGGDEFAVLLEDTDLQSARAVVERMLSAAARPVPVGGEEVVVSLSVGLAEARDGVRDPDQLLVEADTAMYAAKQRGKQGYDVFVPAMRSEMERRSRLRNELERAVSREQFRLHYQPIVSLETGVGVGFEALIRWEHPDHGLLPPSEFIGFAEDSGQIVRMGSWVLRTACLATARLGPASRMSVNVSGRQLRSPALVADVEQALRESGLQPSRLILEITETATVGTGEAQTRETVAVLGALKEMGVQIALDDFGTGFSPLSHLRRFPVDLLKIDRSFVAGITTSSQDEAIVRGIVDLAHALGVRVVAEGVEQPAQRAALSALGCDMAQGFLWKRPTALADLAVGTQVLAPRLPPEIEALPGAVDLGA